MCIYFLFRLNKEQNKIIDSFQAEEEEEELPEIHTKLLNIFKEHKHLLTSYIGDNGIKL